MSRGRRIPIDGFDSCVAELVAQGMSTAKIAAGLGVGRNTVNRARQRSGITRTRAAMNEAVNNFDDRVAELTRQGFTAAAIADVLKSTPRTVTRARRRADVALPAQPLKMTPEACARAAALLADGACKDDVARTLGVSVEVIYRKFRHIPSWNEQQVAEYRGMQKRLASL